MSPARRAELRALEAAATLWTDAVAMHPEEFYGEYHALVTEDDSTYGALFVSDEIAAFIAAARSAVPELLDALDAAEAALVPGQSSGTTGSTQSSVTTLPFGWVMPSREDELAARVEALEAALRYYTRFENEGDVARRALAAGVARPPEGHA